MRCLTLTLAAKQQSAVLRLRNNLYCVEWGVKLYSNQPAWRLTAATCGRLGCLARVVRMDDVSVNVEFDVTLHEQARYRGTLQYYS